jgi:hypothetical protein
VENEKARLTSLRAKKTPIYESLIEFVFSTLFSESREPINSQSFLDFTKLLITWGSNDVLSKYILFRHHYAHFNPGKVLNSMSGLLTAIRKDLGHKDFKDEYMDILIDLIIREEVKSWPTTEGDDDSDDTQGD